MEAAVAQIPVAEFTHPDYASLVGPLFGKPERGRKLHFLNLIIMLPQSFFAFCFSLSAFR